MLFSDITKQDIQDEIKKGLTKAGLSISSRDELLIEASVKTTLGFVEKLILTDNK